VEYVAVREFVSSCKRLIKLIEKPDRQELWLSIKISLLGVGIIGVIAFIIKFISFWLQNIFSQ
jgi:protein transport protein SEC61 subunit gamma-like protein